MWHPETITLITWYWIWVMIGLSWHNNKCQVAWAVINVSQWMELGIHSKRVSYQHELLVFTCFVIHDSLWRALWCYHINLLLCRASLWKSLAVSYIVSTLSSTITLSSSPSGITTELKWIELFVTCWFWANGRRIDSFARRCLVLGYHNPFCLLLSNNVIKIVWRHP